MSRIKTNFGMGTVTYTISLSSDFSYQVWGCDVLNLNDQRVSSTTGAFTVIYTNTNSYTTGSGLLNNSEILLNTTVTFQSNERPPKLLNATLSFRIPLLSGGMLGTPQLVSIRTKKYSELINEQGQRFFYCDGERNKRSIVIVNGGSITHNGSTRQIPYAITSTGNIILE